MINFNGEGKEGRTQLTCFSSVGAAMGEDPSAGSGAKSARGTRLSDPSAPTPPHAQTRFRTTHDTPASTRRGTRSRRDRNWPEVGAGVPVFGSALGDVKAGTSISHMTVLRRSSAAGTRGNRKRWGGGSSGGSGEGNRAGSTRSKGGRSRPNKVGAGVVV